MQLTSLALLAVGSMASLRGSRTAQQQPYHKPAASFAHHRTKANEYVSEREAGSSRGVLNVSLELDAYAYDDGKTKFITRAFNQQLPGPTIRVLPGDRLIINFKNNLQDSSNALPSPQSVLLSNSNGQSTTPYNHPNSTNLHTHGWHVSPLLGSDNVMDVTVGPGESYQYIFDVPDDHMPGTFWYHTHLHGSTMLQTGGGASGMLIIDTPPAVEESFPEWLKEINQPENEQIMMINNIPMTSLRAVSQYSDPLYAPIANLSDASAASAPVTGKTTPPLFQVSEETSSELPGNWNTSAGPVNENNQYQDGRQKAEGAGAFPPGNASTITNIALLNGKHMPTMEIKSGEWKLWKFLHAGPFFFQDITLEPEAGAKVKCEMQLLAKDGISLVIVPRLEQRLILPPAGRADVAVRCIGEGKLALVSGAKPGRSGKWSGDLYWNPAMATIDVVAPKGTSTVKPLTATPYIMPRPAYVSNLVAKPATDVNGNFDMAFVGAGVRAVTGDHPIDGKFNGDSKKLMYPHDGTNSASCLVNNIAFDRNSPIGVMKVNTMQEWSMTNVAGHPLHLHVNPFQLTEIADAVYSPAARSLCDLEFGYTCVGDWLDTLQLPTGAAGGKSDAKFRFMTDTFVGNEVMHCHYLNHEDLGCMTFFKIE